jgi:dTDP-4-amino-4,6-dideoxygalactose transaminase
VGLAQLERYDTLLQRRKELVELYDDHLKPLGLDIIDHMDNNNISSFHLYLVRIPGISEEERNEIILKMADVGIATNVHYKPLPMFTAYKNLGFDIKDYQNAFNQYQNEITLPLHTKLSNEDIKYITMNLRTIIKG